MNKTSIAIIDDHEVVINGLKAMLSDSPDVEVVFATTHHESLLSHLKQQHTDVVFVDIQMPGMDGIELCKLLSREAPRSRIIAFSSFDDSHYIKKAIRSGAMGYILKNAGYSTLLEAVQTVLQGNEFIDRTLQRILVQESLSGKKRSVYEVPLTKREKEILKMIAEEKSNQEIADKLFISLRTVESHRLNLNQKLGAKNVVSLVREAIKRGLIEG